jgi:glycosyltransferase involved in cell wall biosynthesis
MTGHHDVSVVLTAHREGLLAGATLRSLDRAIAYANRHGRSIEVLISLDKSDDLTEEMIRKWAENRADHTQVFTNSFGDPGMSRNQCIQNSCGQFIAILDADDMIGSNWLELSIVAATSDPRNIVWHPEANVIFGESDHIFRHVDMEDAEFDSLALLMSNYWTSLSFARREVFLQIPYPRCDFRSGVGHEDWSWNRLVIDKGYIHKIVKGTGHAIRRKPLSQVKIASAAGALPLFTLYFRKQLEKRAALAESRRSLGPLDAIASARVG